MKISLNWVKQFTKVDATIDELVAKIGEQLGAVEEVINIGEQYQGVVVAKVIACEKHPNADKLSLCLIDDGGVVDGVERNEHGYVQVVCGAPNVREGLLVAWIPPGATVPSTFHADPFVLDARELRGKVSNGMLASAKELAISDSHDGILEVDIESSPGTLFVDVYDLNDYVIDIENKMFTHRPDCFGILGVAREIAGILNNPFTSPDWYLKPLDQTKPGKARLPLIVKNEAPDVVPRFMAVVMADISIKPSPVMIQSYLTRVGLKPVNNVVDTTNYLMHLTGQPTHAYDYDKLKALSGGEPTLIARKAGAKEKADLLNGKSYKIDGPSVVIATDKVIIGVGGVMGATNSEVDNHTKNIVVECASFNMYSVRKTSMKYGLFTDAVSRFNKGQSPLQNDIILEEAVATLQYVSGAHVASDVFDEGDEQAAPSEVEVDYHFVNDRLGLKLEKNDIKRLLENVEMKVSFAEKDIVVVRPPFWRTDLEIAEDIVEEVGRLYGFDKLPHDLPVRSVSPPSRNVMMDLKQNIRNYLSLLGANEVLSYNFVHAKQIDAMGQDEKYAFKLSNAISPELQYYRMSVLPGVLEKVHQNVRSDYITSDNNDFSLYEIGKAHISGVHDVIEPDVPHEFHQLAVVVVEDDKATKNSDGAVYYSAASSLRELLGSLHVSFVLSVFDENKLDSSGLQLYAGFRKNRSAFIMANGSIIGVIGEFTNKIRKNLKLPDGTAGYTIDLELLQGCVGTSGYKPVPRYPKTSQDITLKVTYDTAYVDVFNAVQGALDQLEDQKLFYNIKPLSVFAKDDEYKNISFRVWLANYQKSMTTEEASAIIDKLVLAAENFCNAERV